MSKKFKRKVVHTVESVDLYTVKSVYRKIDANSVYVNFSVEEDDTKYLLIVERTEISRFDLLKKGAIITMYKGDNGFFYLVHICPPKK